MRLTVVLILSVAEKKMEKFLFLSELRMHRDKPLPSVRLYIC